MVPHESGPPGLSTANSSAVSGPPGPIVAAIYGPPLQHMVPPRLDSLDKKEGHQNTNNQMDVQMQAGGCDCGLFAVAFATAISKWDPTLEI